MYKPHAIIFKVICYFALIIFTFNSTHAQNIFVNLGVIENTEVSPDNILSYQVINNGPYISNALITGRVQYRNSTLNFSYSFNTALQSGINTFTKDDLNKLKWSFSSGSLKELFFNYKKLPEGTYQYCVVVQPNKQNPETKNDNSIDACAYFTVSDIFLINLLTPENNVKIHEEHPMFSWAVTFPFASELTYRIRVAELKKGQSKESAITRNNPIYQDRNVLSTGITYPITATPLQKFQPYVWTVDAYYKGILLGGAEVWKFTIVDDSLQLPVNKDLPYLELNLETSTSPVFAVGELKLKYIERNYSNDSLTISLHAEDGKAIKLSDTLWKVIRGDNRKIIKLDDKPGLKHEKKYLLTVSAHDGEVYTVMFQYLNPYYLKQ